MQQLKRMGVGPGSEEGAAHSGKKLCRDLKCLITWLFINPGTLYLSCLGEGHTFIIHTLSLYVF